MGALRHILAVSDGSGVTCELMVKAALTQFATSDVVVEKVANVRSEEQALAVVARAAAQNGVIIFTMVSPALREVIQDAGRKNGVPTVDVLGPILMRLADVLEISPRAHPGLLHHLDAATFNRIAAADFTVRHDDGLGLATLDEAEIVIVGVSRTAKTPTSVYLSYRGWRVANIPLVREVPPPEELFSIDQRKVVALIISPHVLQEIRHYRQATMGSPLGDYLELDRIRAELAHAQRLYAERGWPVVDVTHRSIEETAAEVMRIVARQTGASKGPPTSTDLG
jgi:regulator of PEP synthase PpsR (kinase-PPPase family)